MQVTVEFQCRRRDMIQSMMTTMVRIQRFVECVYPVDRTICHNCTVILWVYILKLRWESVGLSPVQICALTELNTIRRLLELVVSRKLCFFGPTNIDLCQLYYCGYTIVCWISWTEHRTDQCSDGIEHHQTATWISCEPQALLLWPPRCTLVKSLIQGLVCRKRRHGRRHNIKTFHKDR